MPNLVPGFTWHPIDVSGRAKRRKGRGLIGHVAVSESSFLVPPGTPATRNADWHFYLPKGGPGIQFIDLDLQCWSSGTGNATCPAFESQGGVTNPQTEPWTDNQLENAARILAHLNETEGVPLQVMPNSLPGSRGMGYHRLGIDPWRVSGGEVWSSSRGKICPGDAKIAQIPLIVSRAAEIVHGSPTPSLEDDIMLVRNKDTGGVYEYSAYDLDLVANNDEWAALHAAGYPDISTVPELTTAQFEVLRRRAAARRKALITDQHDYFWTVPAQPPGGVDGKGTPDNTWPADRLRGVDAVGTVVTEINDKIGKVQAPDPSAVADAIHSWLDANKDTVIPALGKGIAANLQLTPRDA